MAAAQPQAGDRAYMESALAEARMAGQRGEVPVGAVIVRGGEVVARGGNRSIGASDPTAHAEIVALREAGRKLGNYRLPGVALYVTLEPCAMCFAAMVHARIARLVYGAPDSARGAAGGCLDLNGHRAFNHRMVVVGGVLEAECAGVLHAFFNGRRAASAAR